jgi:steroid delta-isomerase-like uncharacterized protein
MGTTENKQLIRNAFDELANQKKLDALERYCAPDILDHNPPAGAPEGGIDAVRHGFEQMHRALPDLRAGIEEMVAEGDHVFVRCTYQGTHRGELMGLQPTGKRINLDSWHLFRVSGGKVAEHWEKLNALDLLQQVGATRAQAATNVAQPTP